MNIHFDAAYSQLLSRTASGLVVRSPRGDILATKAVIHSNISSPFAAEALVGMQAVRLGVIMGLNTCEIIGDSRTAIKKCQSTERDKSVIGAIISNIQDAMSFFQEIKFHCISREENMLAHVIAREALKNGEGYYLENSIEEQVRLEMERRRIDCPNK
ncbi:hypothetical protein J1N35_021032 [Gossypium stocksii]|uniref:RNase H type-1 domain-containing protein n=1 Tax=Gossypium stocksii TaxID=47602 RepID=A0A9D3VEE4_9ROSI|nr:hypothetical protein J1N35_021032 [Gossypium stocksii]